MHDSRGMKLGTTVAGQWRIERMLASGGFGITYDARTITDGARVALKEYMPRDMCTRDPGTGIVTRFPDKGALFQGGLDSFMKEAEALSRLNHASVVKVNGYREANGTAYMALEFIEGDTLGHWLDKLGRRPTQQDLDNLLWPLLGALIQVHSTQMVHRDIKPPNIMVRADGTPVLIDFGAVKRIISSQTVKGQPTLGFLSLGYAAPEQQVEPRTKEEAREAEARLGPWTDIFALATTIYEMITGRLPPAPVSRSADDHFQPLSRMARGIVVPRPWNVLEPGWRPEFLAAVDQALSLRRSERPQSAVEFRTALGVTAPVATAPEPSHPQVSDPPVPPSAAPPTRPPTTRAVAPEPTRHSAPSSSPTANTLAAGPSAGPTGSSKRWKVAAAFAVGWSLLAAGGFYSYRQVVASGSPNSASTAATVAPSAAPPVAPGPDPSIAAAVEARRKAEVAAADERDKAKLLADALDQEKRASEARHRAAAESEKRKADEAQAEARRLAEENARLVALAKSADDRAKALAREAEERALAERQRIAAAQDEARRIAAETAERERAASADAARRKAETDAAEERAKAKQLAADLEEERRNHEAREQER